MSRTSATSGASVDCHKLTGATAVSQLVSLKQPKDVYPITVQTGKSSASVPASPIDVGGLATFDVSDAGWLWIAGDCTAANASIGFMLVLYALDSDGTSYRLMGVTRGLGLASDGSIKSGAVYPAAGDPVVVDIAAAAKVALVVTSAVGGGTWNIYLKPF